MRKPAMVLGLLALSLTAESQANVMDSILNEGGHLYRLEMACWHGTNIFFKKHKDQVDKIGGCFSYEEENKAKCVFFSAGKEPKVIAVVSLDTSFNISTATINTEPRDFTELELALYTIREITLNEIEKDTSFTLYENASFGIIPVIDSNYRKVYVISQPEVKGVMLFGNDYLLRFNMSDSLISKQKLHNNIIPIDFVNATDPDILETYHTHAAEAGKYITPTDICALMLYRRFAKWKQHLVMSKTHVSLWDMETNELTILTKEQWNKQNNLKLKKQISAYREN